MRQELFEQILKRSVQSHEALSGFIPAAEISPSVDQALYGALEGLDALRKACSAYLLARRIQESIQGDGALLAESVVINEVDFRVDQAQRTVTEIEEG